MKRVLFIFIFLFLIYLLHSIFYIRVSYAMEDPLARPNNFMGIHILSTTELDQAKGLINSSGGDWGYVTIPIQIGDRNLDEWQAFMDNAKALHIIPIIRLATQPDPQDTSVWRKPTDYDIVDFANFLSSLSWPTKNKYVILFNEVNRFDEWGGQYPDPATYADLVDFANKTFKNRDPNFYLILGGMDAAAPNDNKKYMNGFTYLDALVNSTDITSKIDAFSSHSYPNPDFSAIPDENKKVGVATYRYEYDVLNKNTSRKLPVFITETGWSDKKLSQATISDYYKTTFDDIWSKDKDKIVAITPFLLNASGAPFDHFSFFLNGQEKDSYRALVSLNKDKGIPAETKSQKIAYAAPVILGTESFREADVQNAQKITVNPYIKLYFKTILGIR